MEIEFTFKKPKPHKEKVDKTLAGLIRRNHDLFAEQFGIQVASDIETKMSLSVSRIIVTEGKFKKVIYGKPQEKAQKRA